jgi:hypothetical protein
LTEATHPAVAKLGELQLVEQRITEIRVRHREELRPLYEDRDNLARELAETTRYTVPRKSRQTDVQQRLARCPRCRGRLDEAP